MTRVVFILLFIVTTGSLAGSFNMNRSSSTMTFGQATTADTQGFKICIGSFQGACDVSGSLPFDFDRTYPAQVALFDSNGNLSNISSGFLWKFPNPLNKLWAPLSLRVNTGSDFMEVTLFNLKAQFPKWSSPIVINGKTIDSISDIAGFRAYIMGASFDIHLNSTYYVTVRTYDGNSETIEGEMNVSLSGYRTTKLTATNITSSKTTDGIKIIWTKPNSASIAGYQVAVQESTSTSTQYFSVNDGTATEALLHIAPGDYSVWVIWFDDNGLLGEPSEKIHVTVNSDAVQPADVSNFTAEPFSDGVRLTWLAPSDADFTHIKMEFSIDGGVTWKPIPVPDGTITGQPNKHSSYDHLGLLTGKTYDYRIHACDNSTPENCTHTEYAKIALEKSMVEFKATVLEDTVNLTWKDPSDTKCNKKLIIERSSDQVDWTSLLGTIECDSKGEHLYSDHPLESDTYYYNLYFFDNTEKYVQLGNAKATIVKSQSTENGNKKAGSFDLLLLSILFFAAMAKKRRLFFF